ncbi:hypothetical protein niasHS_015798 [Heterodera schachtii]|uniref:F-box domain-containing protein n=1 Tax=Heterodera schachtii TaxID=97005 RepID=A0ABD2HYI2_HETSC
MNPKIIPNELLFEIVAFIRFNRKWARCRVCLSFDQFLISRHADWLKLICKVVTNCKKSVTTLIKRIKQIPMGMPGPPVDGVPQSAARFYAENAYIELSCFINNLPNLPHATDFNELGLNSYAENYRINTMVLNCTKSPEATAEVLGQLGIVLTVKNEGVNRSFKIRSSSAAGGE